MKLQEPKTPRLKADDIRRVAISDVVGGKDFLADGDKAMVEAAKSVVGTKVGNGHDEARTLIDLKGEIEAIDMAEEGKILFTFFTALGADRGVKGGITIDVNTGKIEFDENLDSKCNDRLRKASGNLPAAIVGNFIDQLKKG